MVIKITVPDCLVYEKDLMNDFMKKFSKRVLAPGNFMVAHAFEANSFPPSEICCEVEKAVRSALQKFVTSAFISYDHPHLDDEEQKTFLNKIGIEFLDCLWAKDNGKASWYWFAHADDFIVL